MCCRRFMASRAQLSGNVTDVSTVLLDPWTLHILAVSSSYDRHLKNHPDCPDILLSQGY